MSLSDCIKCWDTPCTCGHGYRDWSPERLRELITVLEGVLRAKGDTLRTAASGATVHGGESILCKCCEKAPASFERFKACGFLRCDWCMAHCRIADCEHTPQSAYEPTEETDEP